MGHKWAFGEVWRLKFRQCEFRIM